MTRKSLLGMSVLAAIGSIGFAPSAVPVRFKGAQSDDAYDFDPYGKFPKGWHRLTRAQRRAQYLRNHAPSAGSKLARKVARGRLGLAVLR